MKQGIGKCDWISWLIGIVAGVLVYWMSVAAVTWLPALLVAVAVACFLGLVLSNLLCGKAEAADAGHAAGHAMAAPVDDGAAKAKADADAAAKAKADADAAAKAKADADAAAKAKADAAAKAKADADADAAAKAKAAAAAAAVKPAEPATPDYDGDGVMEGENEGTRPEALKAPRGGKADNLKEIKGIGPKLETLCNELGFWHFDQIATWSANEVAWVNANLQGFKGRVSRDNWVEQAKVLAAGGETEFSKRVDQGKVY